VQVMKLSIMQSSPTSCHLLPCTFKYSPQQPLEVAYSRQGVVFQLWGLDEGLTILNVKKWLEMLRTNSDSCEHSI